MKPRDKCQIGKKTEKVGFKPGSSIFYLQSLCSFCKLHQMKCFEHGRQEEKEENKSSTPNT